MSQRYQKEIEEILEQAGDLPASKGRPKKDHLESERSPSGGGEGPRSQGQSVSGRRWSISPGRLMLAGVALLLVALVLMWTAVPSVVGPVAWVGAALLVIAYILFFVQPRPHVEKRWRGRAVEDRPQASLLWQRLRRWLSPK